MTQQPSSPVCLVLIDLQLDFYTRIPDVKAAFPDLPHNITQLAAFAREHDIEVVHVRAHYDSDSCAWWELYHDNRPHMRALNDGRGQVVSIEPESFAAERPGEAVIVKHNFDGYAIPSHPSDTIIIDHHRSLTRCFGTGSWARISKSTCDPEAPRCC